MSTIEKLFVQIFDRKRQIVEQLHHQKQLYDQNLASKLLIQGITPPPWLLNSDKLASSSASTSDPKGLNKEELISGLLLPCPQPLPAYSNATYIYGKALSTVGDDEVCHETLNGTNGERIGLDDFRPDVLPQCLFRGLEDVHDHAAESPRERLVSDMCADLDQSLARVQRSRSRQKAFELRSSTKKSGKCQSEDNHSTGPRKQDVFKEGSAMTAGGALSSSKDESSPKKQDISIKEERNFRCTANETAAGVSSSSKDESFSEKLDISSTEEGAFMCAADETTGGVLSPLKDESVSKKPDIFNTEKGACMGTADETNLGVLSSSKAVSLPEKQDISSKEEGYFTCTVNEIDAPTNCLSPQSDCRDLSVKHSLVSSDSVCSKRGMSRHDPKKSVVGINGSCGRKLANSNPMAEELMDSQGLSKKIDISICHAMKLDASSDILSPGEHISQLEVDQPNSCSSERVKSVKHAANISGTQVLLLETPAEEALVDIANSNLLTKVLLEECKALSKEDDNSMCYTKELDASSDLLSLEKHVDQLELDQLKFSHSERLKVATNSSGKHGVLEEIPVTATAKELATGNSEDDMKKASVKQIQKLDDAQIQVAERKTTCFSKEKRSLSPKLLELHTTSSTSRVGRSWPQQKRRKVESVISKSASPQLGVNPSIFSNGVFSATKVQNDINPSSILLEHSSIIQRKEEKPSCQGSHDVEKEPLQVSNVSCLTQQFSLTPQECLHMVDLTRENHDLPFSSNELDADNAVSHGENSSELKNTYKEGFDPDLECFTFEKNRNSTQNIRDNDENMNDKVDDSVEGIMHSSPTAWCQQKSPKIVKDYDASMDHMNTVERKAGLTDMEHFTFYSKSADTHLTGVLERSVAIDLPKNAIDRAEFLERLCRSASLGVPLSYFPASCNSESKVGGCHSVPVGILEQSDFRNTSAINDMTCQLLNASHTSTNNVEHSEFERNSFSHYSPTPGSPFAWDFKGPGMSPFGKSSDGVTVKSRSSSMRGSSNPEYICFPIEESGEEDLDADDNDYNDPGKTYSARKSSCIASEEDMNMALDPDSKIVSTGSDSTETCSSTSGKRRCSNPEFSRSPVKERTEQHVDEAATQTCTEESVSARQPLRDISENAAAEAVHPSSMRGTESFSMASSTNKLHRKISQDSQARTHQSGRLKNRKEKQNSSLGTTGKKHFEPRQTRFSKANASVKSSRETRGGSFSVKEPKPNNIVSSIKSFLPLVQQKQAASCAPVKKDVRVKALEAAEAAKRLAEKKENERLQKKEAMKLERARQEQEKLRQLELLTKAKLEERKRKDAEMAERKRQREEEEEERKEKERKRKRVGMPRKQKKGHDDKMPAEKEDSKSQPEFGKTDNHAALSAVSVTSGDLIAKELRLSSDPSQKPPKDVSANVAGCSTPTPDLSATETVREKSYDMSPFISSDDEGDEDSDSHSNKFIPSWASKSGMEIAKASFEILDPSVIFPPSSFCSLNEFLLPRALKQQ